MIDILLSLLILTGAIFTFIGSLGLARLQDFYTRLHGPTKATTLGVGCLLVASDTDPVREFATDGETALLTDFFDHDRLAARLIEALDDRAMGARLRAQARARIVETVAAPFMWRRKLELLEEALG
jgi:glycosyltransferase involved in cell wall biosynthesis